MNVLIFPVVILFLWCEEYDEILETLSRIKEYDEEYDDILETLSGIKEYDEEFIDKIKINQVGY